MITDKGLARHVEDGELPTKWITIGTKTYVCYADYGVEHATTSGWAVMRIDSAAQTIAWAGGTKAKIHKVDAVASLTYKNIW